MPSRLKRGRKHGLSTYDGVRDVAYLHTECLKGQINDDIDHGAHLYCETTTTDLTAACSPAPVTDWSSGMIKVALVHKNGARTTIGCMYNLCEVTRSVLTAYASIDLWYHIHTQARFGKDHPIVPFFTSETFETFEAGSIRRVWWVENCMSDLTRGWGCFWRKTEAFTAAWVQQEGRIDLCKCLTAVFE